MPRIKYFVRLEHTDGRMQQGKIEVADIGAFIGTAGKYGWVCTKHYEIHNHTDLKEIKIA
jgi:hypothetical protein